MENKRLYISNASIINALVSQLGTVYFDYDEMIDTMVREKYTISQELSIQRQRDIKQEEFAEYNAYVESCKSKAKEIWARQESVLAGLQHK